MEECKRLFDIIKELPFAPAVLYMPRATERFWLESDNCRGEAGEALFQFLQDQLELTGYHSKKYAIMVLLTYS